MRALVQEAGLESRIGLDSAGIDAYHAGERPDRRAAAVARARGVVLRGRARRFVGSDFARFDHVIAMDRENRAALLALAPDADARARVRLLREFDPDGFPGADVPDPYYGGPRGFEEVFEICEAACRGLLSHLRAGMD